MTSMNNNSNNWLGFSLSPQINMEVSSDSDHHHHHTNHHHQSQGASPSSSSAIPNPVAQTCNIFLSPSALCSYEGDNAASLYSQLSVMPLKSDGSLCIMEAFTRSQTQGLLACLGFVYCLFNLFPFFNF